jgi:hypothetical protein
MRIEETEEEMAINKAEWEQIHTTIRDALAQHARGKLAQFKSWSPLGAMVAIGIFALVQWNAYTVFKTHTEDRLLDIDASLLVLRARAIAYGPVDSQSQSEARSILSAARKESIPLPLPVVEQGGLKFVEASRHDSTAWRTALDFVAYRSTLNASSIPESSTRSSGNGYTLYYPPPVPGKARPKLFYGQIVTDPVKFARWERIGGDANIGKTPQPLQLFADGGASSLDGAYVRNVVFTGSEIHYSGAPVILENVIFVNCIFVFDNDDPARKLAQALLASASVTFQNPG